MRKKERNSLRKQTRAEGFMATVRTFLALKAGQLPPQAANEDCEHCQKLQKDAA